MLKAVPRVAVVTLLLAGLLVGFGGGVGVVVADCTLSEPGDLEHCDTPDTVTDLFFGDLLDNIYNFVQVSMQYLGFVAVFAGVTLWFTTENDDRAQTGMWLTFGGLGMIFMYFAFSSIIELLAGIATGFN